MCSTWTLGVKVLFPDFVLRLLNFDVDFTYYIHRTIIQCASHPQVEMCEHILLSDRGFKHKLFLRCLRR